MMQNLRGANLLGAFVVAVHDRMLQCLEREDAIAPQAAAALIVIGFNVGRSVDFLSGALQLSHSGCVRLVDKLEHSELVERREGSDRRVVQLYLTELGHRRMQNVLRSRRKYLNSLMQSLNMKEQTQLTAMIETMLFDITTGDEHAEAMCRYCEEDPCPQEGRPITLAVAR
jgi:DNA-binding MarR family transcriptional regulator